MVKRINKQNLYAVLCALSAASLITANLSAIKTESLFGLTLGGGIITIVVDYVASDMAAEVYGFKKALRLRLLAMACNIYAVLLLSIVAIVPAAPEFTLESAFDSIFTLAPWMVVASMAAFFFGTLTNDWIMSRMHDHMGERGLFTRCILSTIAGGLVDTIVVTLLMYGVSYSIMANLQNIILTYALKIVVEVIVFPLITRHVIAWAKTLD